MDDEQENNHGPLELRLAPPSNSNPNPNRLDNRQIRRRESPLNRERENRLAPVNYRNRQRRQQVNLNANIDLATMNNNCRRQRRHERNIRRNDPIPIPYEWATNQRAKIHNLTFLYDNKITIIKGEVQCKRCLHQYTMEYNLQPCWNDLVKYFLHNKDSMCERAPDIWDNPNLPTCIHCNERNSVEPLVSNKKKSINWLFLLLGQTLGILNMKQLKYFCKYNNAHRSGERKKVLYHTYYHLCLQLDPEFEFTNDGDEDE